MKINLKKPTFADIVRSVKEYVIITFGVGLYAFAWTGVILPAGGVGGGATGLALLIYYATGGAAGGIPIGVSYLVFNVVFVSISIILIGAKFGAKTIFAIFAASILMTTMQRIMPVDANILGVASDKLLSSILGGAISGLGVGLCLIQGGSTGGSDLIAMIINKYRNVSYSRVVVIFDIVVIGCSYFIFHDWATIIYGYVVTGVFGYTTDLLLSGNKQSMQLFVMSHQYEQIADMITHKLHRGTTVLDGTGWYTKQPVKVIMLVCRKTEVSQMMRYIKEIDPDAFITMGSVMGVYGRGFDRYKIQPKHKKTGIIARSLNNPKA